MSIELDDFLAHYGVVGMKWGKHKTKGDFKADVRSKRKDVYKDVGSVYKSKKQVGLAIGATLLGGGAGAAVVGTQMMRGAGYSKGKSAVVGILTGPLGAAVAIERKARSQARED